MPTLQLELPNHILPPPPKGVIKPNCKTKIKIIPYKLRKDSLKEDSIRYYIDWPKIDSTTSSQ